MADEWVGRSPGGDSRPNAIAVWPKSGRFESLEAAVIAGGGELADLADARSLVWADPSKPDLLRQVMAEHGHFDWVSLPFAGIEPYADLIDRDRVWTAGKGVYADPVAEHSLMLGLAGLRGLATYGRATQWSAPQGHNLLGGAVTIFGGGGITESLIGLLAPFDVTVTVVRRGTEPMPGVDRTVTMNDRLDAIAGADLVVLALALTAQTEGFFSVDEFGAMADHAWLVNVARGGHVDAHALLAAADRIGGAALDVTDPEPLPAGHPLWAVPNVLITPHVGNTPEMGVPLLANRTTENVRRRLAGEPLLGVVDADLGY